MRKNHSIKEVITACIFLTLILTISGCGGTKVAPITTSVRTPSAEDLRAPTTEELEKQGYARPEVARITAAALKQRLDNGEPVVIIDARPQLMYDDGHLSGAKRLPSPGDLEGNQTIGWLKAQLNLLPKDRLIVFY
jgi:hypothetical protein